MKIVIAGYGVEGQSNLRYFQKKFPSASFLVTDERESVDNLPDGVSFQAGFAGLADAYLIIRSPSISPEKIAIVGSSETLACYLGDCDTNFKTNNYTRRSLG